MIPSYTVEYVKQKMIIFELEKSSSDFQNDHITHDVHETGKLEVFLVL